LGLKLAYAHFTLCLIFIKLMGMVKFELMTAWSSTGAEQEKESKGGQIKN
jgi:hypothetical protein